MATALAQGSEVEIRECISVADLDACLQLQRDVFGFPELEVSPRRHLVVSREAGGWTLGGFAGSEMVGFVHHLPALLNGQKIGYSHMMAVNQEFQNQGVGRQLKLAQRERAMLEGVRLIRWTWDPMQARNAHFNLNRLGVVVERYAENFYGTNYSVAGRYDGAEFGLDSDRLFATWYLDSSRVIGVARGETLDSMSADHEIQIPGNWPELVKTNPAQARSEQLRVRSEFKEAFQEGMTCRGFARDGGATCYLLQYNRQS